MLTIYADAFRIATCTAAPATPDMRPEETRRSLWTRWRRPAPAAAVRPQA